MHHGTDAVRQKLVMQPEVDRRIALAREWDGLVAQVRALDGFEDYLRPPRLETLLAAASAGPVVIVNVSRWRCDALIVRSTGIDVVEYPNLTVAEVAEWAGRYLEAVRAYAERDAHRDLPAVQGGTGSGLDAVLAWAWDAIAEPVLERLGYTGEAPLPRLWWCPTGPLTMLPLHAAGRHGVPGASVIDRVVSSYTPTLRALMEARARQTADVPASMLVVALPETPGQPSLPNVDREVVLLRELLPAGRRTVLRSGDATVAAVLAELPRHRWAHFSCHGYQLLDDPSNGGLLLYDGQLTIADIGSRRHHGDFAFLSACKTATGGTALPDETITVAAALHYTGYRQVIATLWSVWDETAADVTEAVYRTMTRDGALHPEGAASALHEAVRELRRRHPDRPSVWTPFIHLGP
jgi:hypothetical protein